MGAAAVPGRLDWIAVDWGTSALRAWALDAGGNVLAHAHSQDGMGTLSPDGYEPTLLRLAGGWLPAGKMRVPVIVCGMAGARQGWTEAAYRQIPCRPVAGRQMTPVATSDERLDVAIVPGLCQIDPPDVMRGEETQLAGLMRQTGTADAVVCMPGTHSKWVRVERGDVVGFTTFMTGELFAVISTHSILRHSVGTSGDDRDAFLQGVSDMHAETGTLTAALFGIR
ncbi:MAG: 2-dehydro-3-deoxygalactonokinase, partial [Brucellaceae bacterium]|nr:2-dehydro-3-deoxygalactonokinase [Brucellaceae bacterium]